MNFRGSSSNTIDEHSPHSLKYEEEIRDWEEEIREWGEEQALLMHLYSSNNSLITSCIDEDEQPLHKGSIPGHIAINRGREGGHVRLWNDYFSVNPTYGENLFRRRFRMHRDLFLRIVDAVKDRDNFFLQKTFALIDMDYLLCKKLQLFFE